MTGTDDNSCNSGAASERGSPFLVFLQKSINRAQKQVLDEMELALADRIAPEIEDKLKQRIKRILQNSARELRGELAFYTLESARTRIDYEERKG